jgi:hypothetical protein
VISSSSLDYAQLICHCAYGESRHTCRDKELRGERESDAPITQQKRVKVRDSERGELLGQVRRKNLRVGSRRQQELSAMTSARGSSSEATESNDDNDEAIAGMIKLAIVCDYAHQQSPNSAACAGN